jgi:hypothetical protein
VSDAGPEAEVAGPDEVSATLNAICAAVVSAWREGDPATIGALASRLSQRDAELSASGRGDLGAFFAALASLLGGMPPEEAIRPLVEPYRQGFRAVAADMAAAPAPAGGARSVAAEGSEARPKSQKDPGSDADAMAAPAADPPSQTSDWVAALTAHVAAILKARDRETAVGLAGELEKTARQPGMDPDAAAYLMVMLSVLRGEDVRRRVLTLVEPYRSAYGSLQSLMRGTDPLDALLERLVHNAGLVARSDHPEARAGLDAVLRSLAEQAERQALPELARLVAMLRSRMSDAGRLSSAADAAFGANPTAIGKSKSRSQATGSQNADRAAPPDPPRFSDPRLQAAWLKLDETLRSAN